ncbi:tetratricopeptide repeat protein [bacterium]|nr:tetratricopeptide repeat protein [candidate division CSSED10-310 bacterium]
MGESKKKDRKLPPQIGSYKIISVLGKGGMGIVYKACHITSGKNVALKTVIARNEKQIFSIQREIRALSRIHHPGVVRIYDEGVENNRPWYAMELIKGITLNKFCAECLWNSSHTPAKWRSISYKSIKNGSLYYTKPEELEKILGTTIDSREWDETLNEASEFTFAIPKPTESKLPPAANGKLTEVLNLALKICSAMAYFHGEGVVHRDIKPSNIFIRNGNLPVITDFGLMLEFWGEVSRDELYDSYSTGGTLLYLSPEQIMTGIVDARADLYSFGCILYELVTGCVPFRARNVSQAIIAQLKYSPAPPSHLVDGVPEALDDLILKLLSKKPQDRIGHAGGIISVLKTLGAVDPDFSYYPKPHSYLYRPTFFGRRKIMDTIHHNIEKLKTGQGGLILISGESGIGKTRFLTEISRLVIRQGIQLYAGECPPPGKSDIDSIQMTPQPFSAFKKMFHEIADLCRSSGEDLSDLIYNYRGKILAQYFPEIRELPGQDKYPEPVKLPAESAIFRLLQAMAETFTEISRIRPLILILDDLQWADELILRFLEFQQRIGTMHQNPLLFIATYRSEERNSHLKRLDDSPKTTSIKLEPLDKSAIAGIIGEMLAYPQVSNTFIDFLNAFSNGNPFFVAEYLRACVEENLLFRDMEGRWQISEESDVSTAKYRYMPLPNSIQALIMHRVNLLSDNARSLLDAASVIGRQIDSIILWNVIFFSNEMLDAMDELINREILEEILPGTFRFIHDALQQINHENMDATVRKLLHLRTAATYESSYGDNIEEYLVTIGYHFKNGEAYEKAYEYFCRAILKSIHCYAFEEAENLYLSCLSFEDNIPIEDRINTRFILARDVYAARGNFKAAEKMYMDAHKLSRQIKNRHQEARNKLGIAQAKMHMGSLAEAVELSTKAKSIFEQLGDKLGQADSWGQLGWLYFCLGDYKQAEQMNTTALNMYHDLKKSIHEGCTYTNLGNIYLGMNEPDKALLHFKNAVKIHRGTGRHDLEADNLGSQALVYRFKGQSDRAKKLGERAAGILNRIGYHYREAYAVSNLALFHQDLGDSVKSKDLYRLSLQLHREVHDRIGEGGTLINYATFLYEEGEIEESLEQFSAAIDIFNDVGMNLPIARAYHGMAALERQANGDLERSEKLLDKAEHILRMEKNDIGQFYCKCERGHINLARNHTPQECLDEILDPKHDAMIKSDIDLARTVANLRHAVEVYFKGGKLIHGASLEDLPKGLRNWMKQSGKLSQ